VYDAQGNLLRDIGSGGSDIGQLEEPAGVTIHSDGRLFVADTWNRRVSVFNIDGAPMYSFPVRGWYEDLGNRPYLALDEARDRLYVSDPDAARVLVYDTRGNCVGSFGQAGDAPFAPNQFGTTGGVAVDDQGRVYVVDSRGNRVLRFPAFEVPVAPAAQG
jgi:DNA-binding beta-propeller fold protein YncE